MKDFFGTFSFKLFTQNVLLYNSSWEDYRADAALMKFNADSKICMITGAGCNVLNYLTLFPSVIHSVDYNPNQTSLLDLKVNLIRNANFDALKAFFVDGGSKNAKSVYKKIHYSLREDTTRFWDRHIHYFNGNKRNFYYQGGSGWFARFVLYLLDKTNTRKMTEQVFQSSDPQLRAQLTKIILDKITSHWLFKVWKSPLILGLSGIPKSQIQAIPNLENFIRNRLWDVFVTQNPSENYFWQLYLFGSYTLSRPPYLIRHNFQTLKDRLNHIEYATTSLFSFLKDKSDTIYTHFVLLDHMDWLYAYNPIELNKQWFQMISHSHKGTKFLFRSVYSTPIVIPNTFSKLLKIAKISQDWSSLNDRVNTYPYTYVAEVI